MAAGDNIDEGQHCQHLEVLVAVGLLPHEIVYLEEVMALSFDLQNKG